MKKVDPAQLVEEVKEEEESEEENPEIEKDFTPYGWFVLALFIAVRVSH